MITYRSYFTAMFKTSPVWFLTLALTLFCFCTKEDEKNQLAQQEKNIDSFITSETNKAVIVNKDTIVMVTNQRETNRIVWNPQEGYAIAKGDTAVFAYVGSIFSSGRGAVFATNLVDSEAKKAWPLSIDPPDFCRNAVGVGHYIPGLDAGLLGMRAGEYAYIIFTSQYGFGNKGFSSIPKMSPLMFEVEILEIIPNKSK